MDGKGSHLSTQHVATGDLDRVTVWLRYKRFKNINQGAACVLRFYGINSNEQKLLGFKNKKPRKRNTILGFREQSSEHKNRIQKYA